MDPGNEECVLYNVYERKEPFFQTEVEWAFYKKKKKKAGKMLKAHREAPLHLTNSTGSEAAADQYLAALQLLWRGKGQC